MPPAPQSSMLSLDHVRWQLKFDDGSPVHVVLRVNGAAVRFDDRAHD